MSDTDSDSVAIESSLIGMQKATDTAASSDQLDERTVGITVGDGITPPYDPGQLAALQELNGTHAVAIAKKSHREVGYGFDIVPHARVDPDEASTEERDRVDEFWRGRDTVWKLGPKGTPASTPTEVFEKARQDYYGIGWLSLEIIYAGFDDEPAGLAYLPSKTVRVRKDTETEERVAGHGYVQNIDGQTVYLAGAGDRHAVDIDGTPDPTYVDKQTGEIYTSREDMEADGGAPANELLFIPNPHPNTLYYGLPTWISEIQTMVADQEARRFNRERLENDLILDYVVIVEGGRLSEDSREDIRKNIHGLRNGNDTGAMILEAEELAGRGYDMEGDVSIRIEPMSLIGDRDMSFSDFRDKNERDIAQVHEVPRQLLGHQDATNSNTEEAIREFIQEVVKPAQDRFAERIYTVIHQQLLDVHDWTIDFVTKGGEDEQRQTEIAAQTIDAVGDVMTVNQALEQFGLEPRDDTLGEMLLSEVAPEGGIGMAVEEAIDGRVDGAMTELETEHFMHQGATADD